jgi:hypothetical protein
MLPWLAAAAPIVFLFAYAYIGQTAGNGIWTVAENREIMDGVANILLRPPVEAVQKSSCFLSVFIPCKSAIDFSP